MRSVVGTLTALMLVAVGTLPAAAAPAATSLVCAIDQTRIFTPPLGSLPGDDARYTFTATGTFICGGVSDGAPAATTGVLSVGNRFATPSANPACDALAATQRCADPDVHYGPDGLYGCAGFADDCVEVSGGDGLFGCGRTDWWWQEPAGELTGTPEYNETFETRFVRWGPDDVTILGLGNDDVAWLKAEGTQGGTAVASAEVSATGPDGGDGTCERQPAYRTVAATRDVGAEVRGALWALITPDDPTCRTSCSVFRLVGTDILLR